MGEVLTNVRGSKSACFVAPAAVEAVAVKSSGPAAVWAHRSSGKSDEPTDVAVAPPKCWAVPVVSKYFHGSRQIASFVAAALAVLQKF
mmetsp:Transcript_1931/g.2711  ORF Transcript_1931/g.2711 Transcript_1931/m.2711 type:complete len:88 (+) Transcript_1931:487-750(+)